MNLWENRIPGAVASGNYSEEYRRDAEGKITGVSKVSVPTLSLFLPEKEKANGTAVIIFPGGGYSHLAIDKEGYKVAEWFSSLGVTAFVLKYRLPSDEIMKEKKYAPLMDAQKAVRKVRENAENWQLDPEKIGILGFSAGGHLGASISTRFDEDLSSQEEKVSARPDFSILVYPMISMTNSITHLGSRNRLLGKEPTDEVINDFSLENMVSETTPATFLVHATDDQGVPVENSLNYYEALKEYKVPVELHIYQEGGHGFGMGNFGTNKNWPDSLKQWLQHGGYLE